MGKVNLLSVFGVVLMCATAMMSCQQRDKSSTGGAAQSFVKSGDRFQEISNGLPNGDQASNGNPVTDELSPSVLDVEPPKVSESQVAPAESIAPAQQSAVNTRMSNVTPVISGFFDMKNYWPTPAPGKALLKYFKRETGNNSVLIQKIYRQDDGTYRILDYYYNYPIAGQSTLLSTWHYKFDAVRGVIEFKDDALLKHGSGWVDPNSWYTVTYKPGKELLHGNFLRLNSVIQNEIAADGIFPGSHMWAKVFGTYASYTLESKTYSNVVAMTYKQTFCRNSDCSDSFTDWSHFYHAPQVGMIKHVFWATDGVTYLGEANLYQSCIVNAGDWACP